MLDTRIILSGVWVALMLTYLLGDVLAHEFGWRLAFASAGVTAAIAWLTVALFVPARQPPVSSLGPKPGAQAQGLAALFDFRPVLRNRSAFAYSLAYCVHTLEMNALRGWGVAFLVWVAAATGASGNLFSPALVVTVLGLLGTAVSVLGNEASIRYGRRRLVATAMVLSIAIGGSIGFLGSMGYWIAVGLLVFYGMVIWLDSSSLTAGAAGAAVAAPPAAIWPSSAPGWTVSPSLATISASTARCSSARLRPRSALPTCQSPV